MSLKSISLLAAALAIAPSLVEAQEENFTTLEAHFSQTCRPLYNAAVDAEKRGESADFTSAAQCAMEHETAKKLLKTYRDGIRTTLLMAEFGEIKLIDLSTPLPSAATLQGLVTAQRQAREGNLTESAKTIQDLSLSLEAGHQSLRQECESYKTGLLSALSPAGFTQVELDIESASPLLKRSGEWREARRQSLQNLTDQRRKIIEQTCGGSIGRESSKPE